MATISAQLQDAISSTTRDLTMRLYVRGVLIEPTPQIGDTGTSFATTHVPGVTGLTWSKSFDSPAPVLRMSLTHVPPWMTRGARVDLLVGYNGLVAKCFTGFVQSREPVMGGGQVSAAGRLFSLFRKSEITSRDVDGLTVEQAITAILDSAGITDRQLSIPAFTLGSASDPTLERSTLAQMLNTLMEIDGLRMFETNEGTVRVEEAIAAPSSTPHIELSTQSGEANKARIIEGSSSEDPAAVRTKVTVTGATVTTGSPPNETSSTITASAELADASALLSPALGSGEQIEMEFSNHLIDTTAKAADVASRLLAQYSRLPRTIAISVPGQPQLELGYTVSLNFPDINVIGRYIVQGMKHIIQGKRGYRTELELLGGDDHGGSLGINPIADFSYKLESEVFGDRVYVFATFDASSSRDPDGSIVSYAWSDDETTTPEIATFDSEIATVRIDPAAVTGTWEVTLTVTDDDGLTGTLTKTIPTAVTSSSVEVPAIFVAHDGYLTATPDGGHSWNDVTKATATAVAAKPPNGVTFGRACYGMSDGRILRTTDYLGALAPSQEKPPNSIAITDIAWDWRDRNQVWAVDAQANVYRSTDDGRTWGLYENLRTKIPQASATAYHIELPSFGGVWVFGGTGGGNPFIVYISFSGDHDWQTIQVVSGELGADLPGPAGIYIKDAAMKEGAGLAIIMASAGSGVRTVYWCADPTSTSPAWRRAQGIPASETEGRFIVPDSLLGHFHAGHDNRDVYHTTNALSSFTWTKTSNLFSANEVPNHAIWAPDDLHGGIFPSVHYIATEITGDTQGVYKSVDGFQTLGLIRPATGFPAWPGGDAEQIAVGPSIGNDMRLLMTGVIPSDNSRYASYLTNNPRWSHTDIATALTGKDVVVPRTITSLLWFIIGVTAATTYSTAIGMRSADGGATWATMAAPVANHVWQDVRRGADGVLWGLTLDSTALSTAKIWTSTPANAGADGTWVLKDTYTETGTRLCKLAPHPTNKLRCAAIGMDTTGNLLRTRFTVDGGANWNVNVDGGTTVIDSDPGHAADYLMLPAGHGPNNRIIAAGLPSTVLTHVVRRTDDMGATWRTSYTTPLGIGANFLLGPVANQAGMLLFCVEHYAGTTTTYVVRSRDGGVTWARMVPPVPRASSTDDPNGGIAYDEREDALYVANKGESGSNRYHLMRLSPVDDLVNWDDASGNNIIPTGETAIEHPDAAQALAVIP